MANKKKKKKFHFADLSFLWQIGMAVLLGWLLITFVGTVYTQKSAGMEPTVLQGQSVLVGKLSYRFTSPGREQVILYRVDEENMQMGRIIGLPGDIINITEAGVIEINKVTYTGTAVELPSDGVTYPVSLGADEYFVIADNSALGTDSRCAAIGNISADRIEGKVLFIIWPFADWHLVN